MATIPVASLQAAARFAASAYELFRPGIDISTMPVTADATGWRAKLLRESLRDSAPFGFILPAASQTSFRGTETLADWIDDVDAKLVKPQFADVPGLVHEGFQEIYLGLDTTSAISRMQPQPDCLLSQYVYGHSLGGPLATYHAYRLALLYPDCEFLLVTFASPRLGDDEFAAAKPENLRIVRIVNTMDAIPRLPPRELGMPFSHVGELFRFTKGLPLNLIGNHDMVDSYRATIDMLEDDISVGTEEPQP